MNAILLFNLKCSILWWATTLQPLWCLPHASLLWGHCRPTCLSNLILLIRGLIHSLWISWFSRMLALNEKVIRKEFHWLNVCDLDYIKYFMMVLMEYRICNLGKNLFYLRFLKVFFYCLWLLLYYLEYPCWKKFSWLA